MFISNKKSMNYADMHDYCMEYTEYGTPRMPYYVDSMTSRWGRHCQQPCWKTYQTRIEPGGDSSYCPIQLTGKFSIYCLIQLTGSVMHLLPHTTYRQVNASFAPYNLQASKCIYCPIQFLGKLMHLQIYLLNRWRDYLTNQSMPSLYWIAYFWWCKISVILKWL